MDEISEAKTWIRNFLSNVFGWVALLAILGILGLSVFRIGWVNFVDNYEMAYKFDTRSGKVEILAEEKRDASGATKTEWTRGYIVTAPILVKVHTVDLRPMQVCMNANQRVLNCKLVEFNPAGLALFLDWHGRSDYEGPSGNAKDTPFSEILKSYAFDGSNKTYPFLKVLRELKPEEVQR